MASNDKDDRVRLLRGFAQFNKHTHTQRHTNTHATGGEGGGQEKGLGGGGAGMARDNLPNSYRGEVKAGRELGGKGKNTQQILSIE